MPNHIHAQANIEDILRAQAVRTTVALIKKRARVMQSLRCCWKLSILDFQPPRLRPLLPWRDIMSERDLPRRWFGAGGNPPVHMQFGAILFEPQTIAIGTLRLEV